MVSVSPSSAASKRSACANGNAAISASCALQSKVAQMTAGAPLGTWRSTVHPVAAASSPWIGSPDSSRRSGVRAGSIATLRPATSKRRRDRRLAHGYSSGTPKVLNCSR